MTRVFSNEEFLSALQLCASDRAWRLSVFESIDSTSNELVRRIRAAGDRASIGEVIVANTQSAGRGRQGRVWHSTDPENLYVSASFGIDGNVAALLPLVPLCAGVAAIAALEASGAEGVRLKWPNDLILRGRKLGGILCEAPVLTPGRSLCVVGLGLNLGGERFPEELTDIAISVASTAHLPPRRENFTARWLTELSGWIRRVGAEGSEGLVSAWRQYAEPFGRRVRSGEVEGVTVDLSPVGHLIVACDDGRRVELPGGIVENLDTAPARVHGSR